MNNKQFIIIPYWVESALARNQYNLVDVLDYTKVKNTLSVNDIAQLLAVQSMEGMAINKCFDSSWCLFSSWRSSAQSSSNEVELDSIISPLSCSKDLQEDLLQRLSLSSAPLVYNENDPKYRIVDFDRNITAVVLNAGFEDFQRDQINFFKLNVDLLKSLYVSMSITEVSSYGLFVNYVRSIERSLRQ